MDLNKVTLIGNVVRDPESKSLRTGLSVTRITLATTYTWQDAATKAKRESIDFHDVIAWGRLGDIVRQYVKKGAKLYVEGRLRKRSSRATTDGARRMTTEIVADNMIMLGHRSGSARGAAPANARLVREDVDVDDPGDRGAA